MDAAKRRTTARVLIESRWVWAGVVAFVVGGVGAVTLWGPLGYVMGLFGFAACAAIIMGEIAVARYVESNKLRAERIARDHELARDGHPPRENS